MSPNSFLEDIEVKILVAANLSGLPYKPYLRPTRSKHLTEELRLFFSENLVHFLDSGSSFHSFLTTAYTHSPAGSLLTSQIIKSVPQFRQNSTNTRT
ncbi:predicted protein [Botrytis cinerea T4]|uniref:Uncharacterized protein n=1 Tax=Botryotinia fuckeliana (strain T4) TaxID=999810 RepID=G2YAM9_BOTF4|nr:predicted protein [Botrytis cinerea T4]